MDVLAVARDLLATGPLCDDCLGRPVADRSFGLTSAQRGEALRISLAVAEDEPYEPPEAEDCWVCEGACARHEEWAERAAEEATEYDFATYQVGTRVPPLIEENDRLLREDAGLEPDAGESFKSAFNREVGKRFGVKMDATVDFERPDVVALLNLSRGDVDLQVNPAFVYGRYQKLKRDIPQTEWPCRECGRSGVQMGPGGEEEPCDHCGGSGYMYETSVEEETVPHVCEAMDGTEGTFHGAGREDVDAIMRGTGRPFVIEVTNPHSRQPDVAGLEEQINEASAGKVRVTDLQLATYEMVERVKELDGSKTYEALVRLGSPVTVEAFEDTLDVLDGATVEQYTPERVDHRRASTTRTRDVYDIDGRLLPADAIAGDEIDGAIEDAVVRPDASVDESSRAIVTVHGEGGLYIKELISGDGGRTTPSLAAELGVEATVDALDVLAVEGEDEPFADDKYLR